MDRWHETDDGLCIHARDYPGPDDAAVTVVCLHGLTRNAADFEGLCEHFQDRYRMLAIEQRGRGQSDRDPDPAHYQVGRYVQDTLAMLDDLAIERPVLIGTSMGGLMSMLMLAAAPERYLGAVLNDIGPVVEASGLARIQGYVGKGEPVASWDEAAAAARASNGDAFPDFDDAAWLAFARRLFRERADGRLELDYDPAIAQPLSANTGTAVPPDLWSVFDAMGSTPLLVIRGALSDILAAATVAEMQRRRPDLQAVEVPRVGHAPMLDEPAALTAIEAFLARLAA
ncbi:MAG: alpha/beta fold hydrolase [Gammaproteobacteria bacterium]|nr:MAG: alpha/beta fold hydrolase [Gammaproteobacteria bacterium]